MIDIYPKTVLKVDITCSITHSFTYNEITHRRNSKKTLHTHTKNIELKQTFIHGKVAHTTRTLCTQCEISYKPHKMSPAQTEREAWHIHTHSRKPFSKSATQEYYHGPGKYVHKGTLQRYLKPPTPIIWWQFSFVAHPWNVGSGTI